MSANTRSEESVLRLAAARVRLNLFTCDGSLHAHWTSEDRAILAGRGANEMVWMEELAAHEVRS